MTSKMPKKDDETTGTHTVTCVLCRGTGKRGDRTCPLCRGKKVIKVRK